MNSSRKFSAFGAVRIPKPSRLRRRRHVPRNTSPPRPRPLSVRRRSAFSVAPSHLQSLFEGWQGVGCQILRQAGHGAALSRHHLESAEFHFLGQNVIYILKYLQQRHLYIKVPPRNNCHFTTHKRTNERTYVRTNWAIGNDPPLYAHVHPPVLRSHTPGRRPRTPG